MAAERVATIVESLCGARVSLEDDDDDDNPLLSRIAQQLCISDDGRGALRNITLEHKELSILGAISHPAKPSSTSQLTQYRLPSELERQADCLRSEIQILEQETELLNVRTRQIRKTSHHTTQSIKSLQDSLAHLQSTNRDTTARIEKLSIQMDGSMADATHAAYSLLSSLVPDNTSFDEYAATLAALSQSYTDFTTDFTQYLELLDSASERSREEAELSAEELEVLFRRYSPDVKWEDLPESVRDARLHQAYIAELGDLCDRMEAADISEEKPADVIRAWTQHAGAELTCAQIPDPCAEIEHAFASDQYTYLDARSRLLDNAISTTQQALVTPLDQLFSALSLEGGHVQEAEVMCGVLGEEMESALEVLEHVQVSPQDTRTPTTPTNEHLAKVLLDNAHLREVNAPPLVILNQEDVNRELERLEDRKQRLARQELEVISRDGMLFNVLDNFNALHAPFLDAIYAHSPLNTSPAFAYSPHLMNLMDEAETVAQRLSGETERLNKEVETTIEGRRAQRKLGAFVDRWTAVEVSS